MKMSCTFSLEENVRKKLPLLRKKVVDLNSEVETFLLKLMQENNINIKIK